MRILKENVSTERYIHYMKREEDMERIRLYNDDCLNTFKLIEDKTIDLILIDPPYNIGKDKWDKWATVELYVEFMGKVFKECERVLKDNGSFYFFHNDFLQMVELQNWINKNSNFIFKQLLVWDKFNNSKWNQLNAIVYNKENRNYPKQAEYCLYYTFQDETGLKKVKTDMNNFKNLRQYFKEYQEALGMNKKQIIEKIGQRADHCFRWGSSQWDLPTKETYESLKKIPLLNNSFKIKEYEELRQEYEELRQEYEEQRYTHHLDENHKNIWNSNIKNNGKLHPTQKPLDILERIIKTSSNENDTVLDCFMGSGSTGIACINTNRKFIGIEKDEKYFEIACNRIKEVKMWI